MGRTIESHAASEEGRRQLTEARDRIKELEKRVEKEKQARIDVVSDYTLCLAEHNTLTDRGYAMGVELTQARARIEELRAEFAGLAEVTRGLEVERDAAIAALPHYSGRDENRADEELGQIMHHAIGECGASIGVIEVRKAKQALVHAYAETNSRLEERDELLATLIELAGISPEYGTGRDGAVWAKVRAAIAGAQGDRNRTQERAMSNELREALEQLQHMNAHGCGSGDCPHETTNECAAALFEFIEESAEIARTALKKADAPRPEDKDDGE